jgi:hypothetical protein
MKFESGLNDLGAVAEAAGGGIPTGVRVGRLIHDRGDCGLVMISDRRLTAKSYTKDILERLPLMPVTDDSEIVQRFTLSVWSREAFH